MAVILTLILVLAPSVALAKPSRGDEGGVPAQELSASPDGGASAWDQTTIDVLIDPDAYAPDSSEVKAVREGIDEWKIAITWFSSEDWDGDGSADYPWLDQLDFLVYVKGVNETLLSDSVDVSVTLYYKITPAYVLGYASLSYKQLPDGHNAIRFVEIVLGVKGLSSVGIQNLMAHEYSHALGLGHSDKKSDLMYPSFDASEEKKRVVPHPHSTYTQ